MRAFVAVVLAASSSITARAEPAFRAAARVEVPAGVAALATDGRRVAILTFEDTLIGTSLGGARLFRTRVADVREFPRLDIVDGVAVVMASKRVVAIDAATGKLLWSRAAADSDMLDTSIAGTTVVIRSDAENATVDVRTGKDVAPTLGEFAGAPRVEGKHVDDTHVDVFATDPATHKELWRVHVERPFASTRSHLEAGDLVVLARATGKARDGRRRARSRDRQGALGARARERRCVRARVARAARDVGRDRRRSRDDRRWSRREVARDRRLGSRRARARRADGRHGPTACSRSRTE
jgi:hypothetical protein